jgi:hypothetical protein
MVTGKSYMKMLCSIEIAATAEKIWPFLVEPDNILKWATPLKKIYITSEQRSGLNATFHFEEKALSPLMTLDLIITEWVVNKKISFKMTSSNLVKDYEQKYTIECIPSGCRFTVFEDVTLPWGFFGRIVEPFRQPVSVMYLKSVLAKLKILAEASETAASVPS